MLSPRLLGASLVSSLALLLSAQGGLAHAADTANCRTRENADHSWSVGVCMGADGTGDVYVNRVGSTPSGQNCRIDSTFGYDGEETPGYNNAPCRTGHYVAGDVVPYPWSAGVTKANVMIDGQSVLFVSSPAVQF
jgi:hypothetical protein